MKSHYSISIPKPCHEDWSKMTPNEKGRFCQSCSKTVVDFTKMNVDEIQDYIHNNRNQRICGHIKKSQLNAINLKIPETVFLETKNFHRLFLLALLLTMGTTLLNCSDNEGRKQKFNTVEVVETNQEIIDSISENNKMKIVKSDSILPKKTKPIKSKIIKKEFIEGMLLMGDIVETKIEPPELEEEIIFGFIIVDRIPEFKDTPKNLSSSEKKEYMSKRINELITQNFNTDIGKNLNLKGKQRIQTKFTIDRKGLVTDIKTRAAHPQLENEAKRVISLIPQFIPGQQHDKNVAVVYTLPIVFVVED